ncbi:MAG TPA: winged helix-turn-helix domain-containing protein [Spirillospora sp.]
MIDFDAPEPLYIQIADDLQRRIAAGEIGRRLPGVRVISETYGVAHATAARAVQELVNREAVVAVPGRGTFVKRPADGGEDKSAKT